MSSHYYVDGYNDGVYYVVDDQKPPQQSPAPPPPGATLVKRKVVPHKVELTKVPTYSREWSDDGKVMSFVSTVFIAITLNALFTLPFKSTFPQGDCGHYQEALRWVNASTIAGMVCIGLGMALSFVGIGQSGYSADWYVYVVAVMAWIAFALQAGFAIGAGDNYRIALLECTVA
eukprot:m.167237 g.167237  ORF g.167237 m.167237 type:complete len:174 (+) comp12799_c0_seq1:70-591(+)